MPHIWKVNFGSGIIVGWWAKFLSWPYYFISNSFLILHQFRFCLFVWANYVFHICPYLFLPNFWFYPTLSLRRLGLGRNFNESALSENHFAPRWFARFPERQPCLLRMKPPVETRHCNRGSDSHRGRPGCWEVINGLTQSVLLLGHRKPVTEICY